ncbi:MAG: hypothetical protein HY319_29865 [Armatimonadetes bacterium]|nr:hypothetical protein [Armatimonadota bacterium]
MAGSMDNALPFPLLLGAGTGSKSKLRLVGEITDIYRSNCCFQLQSKMGAEGVFLVKVQSDTVVSYARRRSEDDGGAPIDKLEVHQKVSVDGVTQTEGPLLALRVEILS